MYDVDPHVAEIYDQQETYTDDIALLRRLIGSRRALTILEPFCGTGRLLVPLLRDGHTVVGLDQSSAMLDRARARMGRMSPQARQRALLVRADVTTDAWPVGFDVVVLGANCLYELATPEEQEHCISAAWHSLVPGGHVYVDNDHMEGDLDVAWRQTGSGTSFPTGTCEDGAVVGSTSETIWFDAPARLVRFRRSTTVTLPDGRRATHEYEQQKHPVSEGEVRGWLTARGFRVDWAFGDRDGQPYTPESPRAIFWAKREDAP
jgi:SAM-dependent methyltransferase